MSTVILHNERAGILDLHMVKDLDGHPVVLQPKGMKGDHRECLETVLENAHVKKIRDAKWIRVEHGGAVKAPAAPPAPPAAPPKAPIITPPPTPAEVAKVTHEEKVAAQDDLTVKVDDATMDELAEKSTKIEDPAPPSPPPIPSSKWPTSKKKK